MNKNSDAPQEKPWEQWVYGAEARAAALAAGRSDWQDVTGWPVHLERAHDQAKRIVEKARDVLEAAQKEELRTLNALMANGAVQKRPLEPQPAPLNVPCPDCGAAAGTECSSMAMPGLNIGTHRSRFDAAQAAEVPTEQPPRSHILEVSCPTCKASRGESCTDLKGERMAAGYHSGRIESARSPEAPAWRTVQRVTHQHENWQIRTAPDGSRYCAACGQTTQDAPDTWRAEVMQAGTKQPEDFLMEEAAAEATESFLQQLAEAHPMEEPRIRQQLADAIEVAQEESDVEAREAAASARAAAEARALKGTYDEGTGEHA